MTDIQMHHAPRGQFDIFAFVRQLRQSNFAKFVLYVASITFATQMSVPYFSVYLLKEVGLDYMPYMGVQVASAIVMLLAFPLWGKQADMVGNAKILKLTSFFVPLIPVLWFLGKYPIHFMLAEAFAGFMWSGFNLCATNFVYDSVPPSRRVRALGYYNLVNSVATFLGASLGGHLAEVLPPVRGSALLTLFLISALLRFLANFILSRQFTEVRTGTRKIRSTRLVLSVLGIRPLAGRNVESP
jgi:predicted MFS family arabinose efflux permease